MNELRLQARVKGPVVFAAAILLTLSVIFVALEWYGPVPQPGPALNGALTETQKSAMGFIVDLAKLFMGWSLAVIGAIGYFLKANIDKEFQLNRLDLFFAEAVILASVVSIFYGHLTTNFIATMLIIDVLNLDDPGLASHIRVQYMAFLISLLFFGAYVHSTFFKRSKSSLPLPASNTK